MHNILYFVCSRQIADKFSIVHVRRRVEIPTRTQLEILLCPCEPLRSAKNASTEHRSGVVEQSLLAANDALPSQLPKATLADIISSDVVGHQHNEAAPDRLSSQWLGSAIHAAVACTGYRKDRRASTNNTIAHLSSSGSEVMKRCCKGRGGLQNGTLHQEPIADLPPAVATLVAAHHLSIHRVQVSTADRLICEAP